MGSFHTNSFVLTPPDLTINQLLSFITMNRMQDKHFSIHAYVNVKEGKLEGHKEIGKECMKVVQEQNGILYYTISYNGDETKAYFREGYKNADAFLFHKNTNNELIMRLSDYGEMYRLECHCTKVDWEKVNFLADFGCEFWEISALGSMNKNVE